MKEIHSNKFIHNNPKKMKELSKENKISLLTLIIDGFTLNEIEPIINYSLYGIRKFLKQFGIKNLQIYKSQDKNLTLLKETLE